MATVRIADDVNAAYKAIAANDPHGRSVTQLVDEQLRIGAGMIDPPERTPARTSRRTEPVAQPAKPQVKQAAKRDKTADTGEVKKCTVHPPGRVIDGVCMACGHPAKG